MDGLAQIQHLPDGAVALRFPYDAEFISRLKDEIPASARTYDPETKTWTVRPAFAERAVALMRETFAAVVEYGADRTATSPPDPTRRDDPDLAVLHLLPSAPPELIETAYRCLSKLCHPDKGGEHDGMLELNEAITRLRQRLGATA
jgi:hypothetical protein